MQPGATLLPLRQEPALGEQSAEEAYFNGYRHSAWVEADRDMVRTLREWLGQGELGGVSLN